MLFATLVEASAELAATRSRLAKTAILAEALRAAEPSEVELVAWYLSGRLPQRRTGVGWRGLADLPPAAEQPSVTTAEIDAAMRGLESQEGAGSAGRRRELVRSLFSRLTGDEQEHLRALMLGNVRQGASDGVLLPAIAAAAEVPEAAVRRALMLAGFAAPVARIALSQGEPGLAEIGLVPGRPLRPMLAGSAPTVAEAVVGLSRSGAVVIDRKLDGIRLQVHKVGAKVTLFTRSLDDITDRLPGIVDLIRRVPAHTLVLDGEALALRADGRPEPFQVTGSHTSTSQPGTPASTASSGTPASSDSTAPAPAVDDQGTAVDQQDQHPVRLFAFDALHVDGDDLVDLPLRERLRRLDALLEAQHRTERVVAATEEEAVEFFDRQVREGHEGVIVKALDAPYAAGRRGAGWVKVKPRHTLDLVVLAVEWGSGRRRGLLSNIHLGARTDSGFVMLGKTFKGMTDEMLGWQTTRFQELETHREGHVVYVRPEQVVEIALDGVQRSTRYPGGVALRFARVLRYRDDKTPDEIDTLATVLALRAE